VYTALDLPELLKVDADDGLEVNKEFTNDNPQNKFTNNIKPINKLVYLKRNLLFLNFIKNKQVIKKIKKTNTPPKKTGTEANPTEKNNDKIPPIIAYKYLYLFNPRK